MLKPIGNRALVKLDAQKDKIAGGIIVPVASQDKPAEGTVVALGAGWREPAVKEGSRVLISKYGGTEIKHAGATLIMCDEKNVHAVIG